MGKLRDDFLKDLKKEKKRWKWSRYTTYLDDWKKGN